MLPRSRANPGQRSDSSVNVVFIISTEVVSGRLPDPFYLAYSHRWLATITHGLTLVFMSLIFHPSHPPPDLDRWRESDLKPPAGSNCYQSVLISAAACWVCWAPRSWALQSYGRVRPLAVFLLLLAGHGPAVLGLEQETGSSGELSCMEFIHPQKSSILRDNAD